MGACGHVLSCQALNATASRGHSSGGDYLVLKTPEHGSRGARVCPAPGG
jgi:hypothetical protein